MIIAVAIEDASLLAALSSSIHKAWALSAGGTLEDRPRYNKARCFDPFPFPDPSLSLRQHLADAGEELDALRKKVLADHPDLTLTGLYNVLEKVKTVAPSTASGGPPPPLRRGGTSIEPLTAKEEDIKQRGLVLILKELHETIDRLTAEAYGWPVDLSDEQILERLVALNAERAREEATGHVRWLRPDYQIPRFAKSAQAKSGELELGENIVAFDKRLPAWPSDRNDHSLAVEAVLVAAQSPMTALDIARRFRSGGKKIEKRVEHALQSLERYGHISAISDGRFVAQSSLTKMATPPRAA